ncbi:MAG: hypothetical protein ABL921_22930 [Pirellula sp.]
MALTTVQLWELVASSGLATPDECRRWAIAAAESNPNCLHEPNRLLAELIGLKKITPFQANVLYRQIQVPLTISKFRLTSSLEAELGPYWFEAIDSSTPNNTTRWLHLLTANRLASPSNRNSPPSLKMAEMHLKIVHPSIDRWQIVDVFGSNIVSVCLPVPGCSLASFLARRLLSWQESASMIEQIAHGLHKLHSANLIHGQIHAAAVWRSDAGEYVLRRDPIFPVANVFISSSESVIPSSIDDRLGTAAPELTLPATQPSIQTDLYALGCLWYRSLNNQYPHADASDGTIASWARAQTTGQLDLRFGESANPALVRCLSHLLAKNTKARFSRCDDLLRALEYAQTNAATTPVLNQISFPPPIIAAVPTSNRLEQPKSINEPTVNVKSPVSKPASNAVTNAVRQQAKSPVSNKISNTVGKKKGKKKKPVWLIPSMAIGGVLFLGVLIAALLNTGDSNGPFVPDEKQIATDNSQKDPRDGSLGSNIPRDGNSAKRGDVKPEDPLAEYFAVVVDDGKLLWAPPHAGQPFSMEMLPAGVEGVVFLSANAWQQRGKWSWLGKWWKNTQRGIKNPIANYPILGDASVETVAIGLYPGTQSGTTQSVYRVSLSSSASVESLAAKLDGYELQLLDPSNSNKGVWTRQLGTESISVAMEEMQVKHTSMVKRFTIGPTELIKTMSELRGSAPMRRQMETLLMATDGRSDVTLLAAPSFLFGDGRELTAAVPGATELLREVVHENNQAVSVSTTLEPRWYVEVRMLSSETREAGKQLGDCKRKLEQLPDAIEANILMGEIHPYWRAVAIRFPQMLRSLNKYTRFGLEDGQVVFNAYLPTEAGSNLAVASWMAMNEPIAMSSPAAMVATPNLKSMEEILNSKISVAFEQESLEAALQLIASEVAESVLSGTSFPMTINYDAFKIGGITQNQQIRGFQKSGIPVRTVLTDLVRMANPVTTVQSPTEANQKVVWIVRDAAEGVLRKKIELTTRVWSESNKAALPKEFVAIP